MKVKELIEILKKCDQEMPIATHANNHEYMSKTDIDSHGKCRVALLKSYGGDHVIIGNFSRKELNKPNWYIEKVLDGGDDLPDDWR